MDPADNETESRKQFDEDKKFEPEKIEDLYQQSKRAGLHQGTFITREQFAGATIQFTVTVKGLRKLIELGIELGPSMAAVPLRPQGGKIALARPN